MRMMMVRRKLMMMRWKIDDDDSVEVLPIDFYICVCVIFHTK